MPDNKTSNGTELKPDERIYIYERTETRTNLNGSYFRMGLVIGLVIAVLAVYITYEVMS